MKRFFNNKGTADRSMGRIKEANLGWLVSQKLNTETSFLPLGIKGPAAEIELVPRAKQRLELYR